MTKEGEQKMRLKCFLEEVERAKRFGFSQNELDRAKSETLSNLENLITIEIKQKVQDW